MNAPFVVNKLLSKALALIAKNSEETINFNNTCIQSLKEAIMSSNRKNLLAIKASLKGFTMLENEREFKNILIELYLQLIEQQLRKNSIP